MRITVAAIATLIVLAGCGGKDKNDVTSTISDLPTETATSASPVVTTPPPSVAPSTLPPQTAVPNEEDDVPDATNLVIGFGSVGPAKIGMSKSAALATGVFDDKTSSPSQGCPAPQLTWKKAYSGVDVLTDENGTITSLGVSGQGPTTRAGVGVGSSLEGLRDIYGGQASQPAKAGYGQSGVYVQQGDGWIGFLFNDAPDKITGASLVKFVEVSTGTKPDLMRDGC